MKLIIPIKFQCINCGRTIKWKGTCLSCYNSVIGNKQSDITKQKEKYISNIGEERNPLFGRYDYCGNCKLHDCSGCVVISRSIKEIEIIPDFIKTSISNLLRTYLLEKKNKQIKNENNS